MTITHDDLVAAVCKLFPDDEMATIIAALDRYGTEPYGHEKERVRMAIVELCEGSRDKLLYLVQCAKTDYRDVLAWRQLGPLSKSDGAKLQDVAKALIETWGKGSS